MHAQNISNFTSHTLSATDAGRQFGYTNDYITRLAREKKILATRVGRQWYVDPASIENFIVKAEEAKKAYAEKIRTERKLEQVTEVQAEEVVSFVPMASQHTTTLVKTGILVGVSAVVGVFLFTFVQIAPLERYTETSPAGVLAAVKNAASWVYSFGFGSEVEREGEVTNIADNSLPEHISKMADDPSGLVVLPHGSSLTLEEVARSFSDEVSIEKDADGKSGVITPSFQSGSSTPYRFLLVPVNPP